jgi:GT2 family glycosyltransferase
MRGHRDRTMKISVVVPAYNAAATLAATLDSLLAQTEPAVEIIVVDDGSKDDTRGVLARYGGRVKGILQTNSGVSAARNRGVAESSGEWVAFCDADDLWDPDKLRVAAAVLRARPEANMLFHDFSILVGDQIVEERGTYSLQHPLFPLFREFNITMPGILTEHRRVTVPGVPSRLATAETWFGTALKWLMVGNFLQPSTVLVRKSAFLAAGGFDGQFRYAEDTEFFLRFAKATPFLWVDLPLTRYRRAPGTLLTGNMLPTITNATRAVVKHCLEDEATYRADPSWVRRAVSRRFTRLAYYCLTETRRAEAFRHALTAIRQQPLNTRAWAIAGGSLLPSPLLRSSKAAARQISTDFSLIPERQEIK